ncbi:MAG TPA: hexitol phosphatase HxpB [Bacteroidia bacterium]|nr:hexitol phosphatase HxpB [Bacteroidia bacterium]
MISAVIFDMDGLIVDSEPWWRVAESNVFGKLSTAPRQEEFEKMMGWQIKEVIRNWYNLHPWKNFSLDETQKEIIAEVEKLVKENSVLLPGVISALEFFRKKNIALALASSSPLTLIRGLMQHYEIYDEFSVVCSAEFEEYGKPHPAIFLTTAKHMKVNPAECLVLEDSFNGVIAAKAAKMKCIAVPSKEHFSQTRFDIADLKLSSLDKFSEKDWEILNS